MSDLTLSIGSGILGRHINNPNENHEAVPLNPPKENRLKSRILAFELRFSAAC